MSGTADIVRALGGPRLVPARSPGQLRALVREGLPYAALSAVVAGFGLGAADAGDDPAHSGADARPAQEGEAALGRGIRPARSPRPHRRPRRRDPRQPRERRPLARRPRTGRSAAALPSPSSTRTSAPKRSRRFSSASPTGSSASGSSPAAMRVFRICRKAHAAFDGEGARLYGGRWNRRGTAVVYASESLALAALELLVHAEPALLPGRSRRGRGRRPRHPGRRVRRRRAICPATGGATRAPEDAGGARDRVGALRPHGGSRGALRARAARAQLPAQPRPSGLQEDPAARRPSPSRWTPACAGDGYGRAIVEPLLARDLSRHYWRAI